MEKREYGEEGWNMAGMEVGEVRPGHMDFGDCGSESEFYSKLTKKPLAYVK